MSKTKEKENLPVPVQKTHLPAPAPEVMEQLVKGNLGLLKPAERVSYVVQLCNSLGLNPLTQPFLFVDFQGKIALYATKACTEQLRKLHKVSIRFVSRELVGDVFEVVAEAKDGWGRVDQSTGAVNVAGLKGNDLANARMKAETKAKRRVTLSICGLGFLDESELETIRGAKALSWDEALGRNESQETITDQQYGDLISLANKKGVPLSEVESWVKGADLENLTVDQWELVMKMLEFRLPN